MTFADDEVGGKVPDRPPFTQGGCVVPGTAGCVDKAQSFGASQIVSHDSQSSIPGLDSPGCLAESPPDLLTGLPTR
ncbi:hypothetical protein GCM10010974_13480 [Brevibacterium sediminis]|uniref:Uncharacterized protein n=1 Tax=Brevibacterium sediminis TaxID=1857024 RepID=A0ABQ1M0S2_9MICO|nr:hypothetical protein GCM10010974_13480 [Brevibacterium sediminis]